MRSNGASATTKNAAVSALRFFFGVNLDRGDANEGMTTVREPRKLAVVLSPEAGARLRERRNRWTLWLPAAALALYLVYEIAMPRRWNIRLDLLLILPLLLIVGLAWLVRLVLLRRGRRA